jgi:hypothetical protein
MHRECFRRHVALRIEMPVKGLPGRHAIDHLDAADFNQAGRLPQRVEAVVSVSRTISRMN